MWSERMREDDWVKEAMTDDLLVVELLMRLCHSEAPLVRRPVVAPSLEWGMRQPRSRHILRCNIVQVKKEGESRRASPTTPLSWSGGTSVSGGGGGGVGAVDGYEESSRPAKRSSGGRSKVTAASETSIRRSRKKKTFAELKEDESLLLKDRIHLKKEVAMLRIACEEQRARNDSLKRMKLLLAKKTDAPVPLKETIYDEPHHMETDSVDHTPMNLPTDVRCNELDTVVSSSPPSNICEVLEKDVATEDNSFVLPDLNLPIEEDSGSEVLYGMS